MAGHDRMGLRGRRLPRPYPMSGHRTSTYRYHGRSRSPPCCNWPHPDKVAPAPAWSPLPCHNLPTPLYRDHDLAIFFLVAARYGHRELDLTAAGKIRPSPGQIWSGDGQVRLVAARSGRQQPDLATTGNKKKIKPGRRHPATDVPSPVAGPLAAGPDMPSSKGWDDWVEGEWVVSDGATASRLSFFFLSRPDLVAVGQIRPLQARPGRPPTRSGKGTAKSSLLRPDLASGSQSGHDKVKKLARLQPRAGWGDCDVAGATEPARGQPHRGGDNRGRVGATAARRGGGGSRRGDWTRGRGGIQNPTKFKTRTNKKPRT